jgi:NitT/TauT family transport system permease protein
MFTLGDRDLRLPGLGSYLQTAANAGNTHAIFWGMGVMIGIIVVIDQLVWRPVIAWAERFKFEQVESTDAPVSPVLNFLRSSRILPFVARYTMRPAREWLTLYFARRRGAEPTSAVRSRAMWTWISRLVMGAAAAGILYAFAKMILLLSHITGVELRSIFLGAGATLLRVAFTLFLAGLWTIPVGVMIGLKPKLSAIAQPIVQVAASVPATALFPIILLLLIRVGGGLGVGSIILLLLGTQWYLLFNVIAGATAIPTDLKEVCNVYQFRRTDRWRELLLPGIFPFLITGFVTASGGAWNASIIAEYFHFRGHTYMTTGLGAVISNATDTGNFRVLLAATIVMAAMVVTINRLVWRRMYNLAATRFRLEN